MGSSPKPPPPTQFDKYVRARQQQDINKLDVLENQRKKAILRGRLGLRQLLTGDSSFAALADAPSNFTPSGRSRGRGVGSFGGFSPGGSNVSSGGSQFGGGRPPAQQ